MSTLCLCIAAIIVFGVILIKAAKKRREKRPEAIHQLFNPDEDKDTVNISLDNSNDQSNSGDFKL